MATELRLVEPTRDASWPLGSRWPLFEADEIAAATAVLASGRVNALVHGEHVPAFEQEFARFVGVDHAIALANGTVALELGLRALGIGAGDEVIVPARSFFASVSCVIAVGATPVFADIDPVSQNISVASAARMISARTRAILCVHLAGWPCDMAALMTLCDGAGLFLVEDCAQAHGAAIGKRRVGSFGDVAAFSFCTDKIMSTGGEGGMLTMGDRGVWLRAWAYKDHGKNPDKMAGGHVGSGFRYVHDSFGSNFRMTELQAAIGRRQLAKLPGWLRRRQRNAAILRNALRDHPAIDVPIVPATMTHAWYKFNVQIRIERTSSIDEIVTALRDRGITCGTGSCPDMSREAAFARHRPKTDGTLPGATRVGDRNLLLAVDHLFDDRAMMRVADAVRAAVAAR